MPGILQMQPDKIPTVERQQRASLLGRARQNGGIGYRLSGATIILNCQYLMAKPPQMLDHLQGEIFIGVQTGHQSSSLARIC
jgi:hypothetical protein